MSCAKVELSKTSFLTETGAKRLAYIATLQ
jgi:hypothetical protein